MRKHLPSLAKQRAETNFSVTFYVSTKHQNILCCTCCCPKHQSGQQRIRSGVRVDQSNNHQRFRQDLPSGGMTWAGFATVWHTLLLLPSVDGMKNLSCMLHGNERGGRKGGGIRTCLHFWDRRGHEGGLVGNENTADVVQESLHMMVTK